MTKPVSKENKGNADEALGRPIRWFIGHLAALWSCFCKTCIQWFITLLGTVVQLCHFMSTFLSLGAFFNTAGTEATTLQRIRQKKFTRHPVGKEACPVINYFYYQLFESNEITASLADMLLRLLF